MRTFVPNTTAGPRLLAALAPDVSVLDIQVEPEVVLLTVTPSSSGETKDVADLLPDPSAETVAAWLKAHSGIEVVTRDRSTEYARCNDGGT